MRVPYSIAEFADADDVGRHVRMYGEGDLGKRVSLTGNEVSVPIGTFVLACPERNAKQTSV